MSEERFLRPGVELVAGAGIASLSTIVAIIYAGRVLGPVEYADFSAALAVIYIIGVALSPVTPTVARVAARHSEGGQTDAVAALRRAMLRFSAIAIAITVVVMTALLWPLTAWLRFRSPTPLALAIFTAIVFVVLSVERGFQQGTFKFRQYNLNTIIEAVVRATLILVFAARMPTAGFAMFAWACGSVAAQIAVSYSMRRLRSSTAATADWTEFSRLVRPIIVLMFALAIFQNADILAVKRWLRDDLAGAYGAAQALARGFTALVVPLYALSGPMLTRTHERNGDVFRAALRLTLGYLALTAVPLVVVALWPARIVALLFGVQYADAAPVLVPLCVVAMLSCTALMLSQAPLTVGDYRFVRVFALGAVLEIAGLALFHDSFREVLTVLFVAQGVALLLAIIVFLNSQKITRLGSSSNSR